MQKIDRNEKVIIPGFQESIASNRIISKKDALNESIEFCNNKSQLFLLFFKPGDIRPLHKHNESRVTFIRSGKARFVILGKETIATAGDMVVILPDVEHSLEVIGDESLILAEFLIFENLNSTDN